MTWEFFYIMKKSENKERCVLTTMVKSNLDLVNRHITVLKALQRKQPMGITELSEIAGYPQHKIRYSLQVLEQEGLVEPSIQGAVTTENADDIIKRLRNSIRDISMAYNELLKKLE
jgi:predicted transcriptional regulator